MIRKITIHERTAGIALPVGVLVSEKNDLGWARCQFRYLNDYLLRDDSFPIDPASLPLRSRLFTAERKIVFDVFEETCSVKPSFCALHLIAVP
jgi:hypothetical protein